LGTNNSEVNIADLLSGLPLAGRFYQKWITDATATEIVAVLRRLSDEAERKSRFDDSSLQTVMYNNILDRVAKRKDGEFIRVYAESGEPPPDFVWRQPETGCPSSRAHRGRVSKRERRRHTTPSKLVQGFRRHLAVEQDLRETVWQPIEQLREKRDGKSAREIVFAENYGARQLFSIPEAEELLQAAEIKYGRENKAYVTSVIQTIVKLGNRRDLAKAPSQEAIDFLRRDFPNAEDVINQIERAAALSRLTPDGFFQMPPTLLWGDPGVGKTAFMQAVARCLGVPFRRFDIGALSMGGQLFGLSLGWATGRTGDIFRMLTESEYLNSVVLLDEVEKAGGNPNAPVIPGLLALLEKETSKTYRDEAIDLALDASHLVWFAAGNERCLMSRALQSRFIETRIERPEGEGAVRVANSIYRSLRTASPWGRLFPEELDRAMALRLANFTPREISQMLTVAFGEAAVQGRTYLKITDFPPVPKSRPRMGFV
jgi:ATP-dependent Lon protease